MREILFRAKVKFECLTSVKPKKKEQVVKWVYWGVYGQTVDEIGNAFPYDVDGLRVVYIDTARRFIIPETVGQYTGTDKNGKKIFEGDIVKAEINGSAYDKFVFPLGVVEFENGVFGIKDVKNFTPLSSYAPRVSFEVIGNIHDNPEFLEGKK